MLNETGYGSASNGNMLDTGSYHIAFSLKKNLTGCFVVSVQDRDPHLDPDPYVFGPLDPTGSGSTTWSLSDTTGNHRTPGCSHKIK
jgi:hypothetical protein